MPSHVAYRRVIPPPPALGPADAGRWMSEREYLRCEDRPGYVSELIDGVVAVSPSAKPVHQNWQMEIGFHLKLLSKRRPATINHVAVDNDVVIPGRLGPTRPRPDVTAYQKFPKLARLAKRDAWAAYCPVLVVEIVSSRRLLKDTVRNRKLYWLAEGIREYWVVDPRRNPVLPTLTVYAREAGQSDWVEYQLPADETWRSKLLRGLSIRLADFSQPG